MLKKDKGFIKRLFNFQKEIIPVAYYCEMNGFTINWDKWFINLFSYKYLNNLDWDWLSDFNDMTSNDFVITGFEDLQQVF